MHRTDVLEGWRLAVVGRQDAHREAEVAEVAPVFGPEKFEKQYHTKHTHTHMATQCGVGKEESGRGREECSP